MAKSKLAASFTVKNEADLLLKNISIHKKLGVEVFFVYFDGTTDSAPDLLKSIDEVYCFDSVHPADIKSPPKWVDSVSSMWIDNMDVRKRINTLHSVRMAGELGCDWLISIDPDEIVIPSVSSDLCCGGLVRFFGEIPDSIDQVLMPNVEAIPLNSKVENPFLDCIYFLRRFPLLDAFWRLSSGVVRRMFRSPLVTAYYDHYFYKFILGGDYPRMMRHPDSGEKIPAGFFLGYSNYKSALRVGRESGLVFNIHKWDSSERRAHILKAGTVLHFDIFNPQYFKRKFRQRGPAMLVRAFHVRYMLAIIARSSGDEAIDAFFEKNIAISDTARLKDLVERGIIVRFDGVSKLVKD